MGFFFGQVPPDGSGIHEDLGAFQCGQAGSLGKPLVPADQNAHFQAGCFEYLDAEISGREVELFEVERIVRDVHLAILAQVALFGINDARGVVVHAFRAFLEQAQDEGDAQLLGELLEVLRCRAGNGLGQVEQVHGLGLAEVPRLKKFGHADQVRTFRRCLAGQRFGAGQIFCRIVRTGKLQGGYPWPAIGNGSHHRFCVTHGFWSAYGCPTP